MKNIKSNYDLQVESARKIFLEYDQDTMIKKFQLKADDLWLYLQYLNTPYRINRITGDIEEFDSNDWKIIKTHATVMTIYDFLCFPEGDKIPVLSGEWCNIGTFVMTGVRDTEPFTKKYAQFFDRNITKLKEVCQAIGGVIQPAMAGADLTCLFHATAFFPVLLQFWEGDEDFDPKIVLMWDKNSDQFLRFETTFYLQKDLLEKLKELMDR